MRDKYWDTYHGPYGQGVPPPWEEDDRDHTPKHLIEHKTPTVAEKVLELQERLERVEQAIEYILNRDVR